MEKYIFIIDTDEYAGNFEREMCAFCTGTVGDCEVGHKERKMFVEDCGKDKAEKMLEMLDQQCDDHGCFRPASIGGNKNKSVYIYFYDKPCKEDIAMIKTRAERFSNSRSMQILGYKMKRIVTTTEYVDMDS